MSANDNKKDMKKVGTHAIMSLIDEDNGAEVDDEDDWIGMVICCDCRQKLDYDDCVHYEEDIYLCQTCGEGLDNICIDCYTRPCECPHWTPYNNISSSADEEDDEE